MMQGALQRARDFALFERQCNPPELTKSIHVIAKYIINNRTGASNSVLYHSMDARICRDREAVIDKLGLGAMMLCKCNI